ncbi:anti-sigma factor family protein [Agromyces bauzanensis]|uniref:Anti-sigma factor n=1 Tax=Agromyces bauzanensis TaxID=1308924 RepID=A0A917P917_9MICO|nr:zf-HC2 domain-containing protein [Agromyces bauzanensis]GGJ67203.1 anti-sigma factor [Agromyces bauzanensis]
MNADHERFADWDSAYVLGALSPAERREYEGHLETCERCRRAVEELAPMPGLLARLTPERAEALLDDGEGVDAKPAPRPELLAAVRHEARRRRIRRTRLRYAVAAAAGAVALTAVVVPIGLTRTPPGVEVVAFETVAEVPVTATAELTPVAWGTRIDLDCTYESDGTDADAPQEGWSYALYVVDRDGTRRELSSWRASPGATARLEAGTAVDLDDIASLEIRAVASGDMLLLGTPD